MVLKIPLGETKSNINEYCPQKIIRYENLQDDATVLELKQKDRHFIK